MGNSAQEKQIESLTVRVEELEKRALGKNQDTADDFDGLSLDWDGAIVVEPYPITAKRGRNPKWDVDSAKRRKVELFNLLRDFWDCLEPLFQKRISAEDRQLRMKSLFEEHIFGDPPKVGHMAPPAKHLLEHYNVLDQVLRSGRFNGKPETVANAMAGVPFVSWQTSLKALSSREHSTKPSNRKTKQP